LEALFFAVAVFVKTPSEKFPDPHFNVLAGAFFRVKHIPVPMSSLFFYALSSFAVPVKLRVSLRGILCHSRVIGFVWIFF